jgi:hypothetical protein
LLTVKQQPHRAGIKCDMQECNLITSLDVINFRIIKDKFIWLLILELIKICNKEQPSLSKKKEKKRKKR